MAAQKTSRPPSQKAYVAVAAIDFGTTCTGYAYYLRRDRSDYLNDINNEQAWKGSQGMGSQAPTTVLMDPSKKFDSFGFEAENKYKQLSIEGKHSSWYYFRHFKMYLHHQKELSRDMLLEDAEGKTLKALVVFTEAIQYVKSHLQDKINAAVGEKISDVNWVITVPAIWRDSAKQFMREAAIKAGIQNKDLQLALEPESAAIFCKELAQHRVQGVDGVFLKAFDPREKYIVVDLGGGTVDTTAHEVLQDGMLKELYAATGGPWGGELVNNAFHDFLEKLVGIAAMDRFRKEETNAWITLQDDFEKAKREFTPNTDTTSIRFPIEFESIFKEGDLEKAVQKYNKNMSYMNHNLILKNGSMKTFFMPVIDRIIKHIEDLRAFPELRNVSTILLVGGFSESQVVSSHIREHFRTHAKFLRVLAPGSAGSAIIKGAVMFGINRKIIASRISPYTYGLHTRRLFKDGDPPKRKRTATDGRSVVNDAFDIHLQIGETVSVGESKTARRYKIINRSNTNVFWKVYQSEDKDPQFCDEKGCKYIGKLQVQLPSKIKESPVFLDVKMTCRGTELEASVTRGDNVMLGYKFDFLEKEYLLSGDEVIPESVDLKFE